MLGDDNSIYLDSQIIYIQKEIIQLIDSDNGTSQCCHIIPIHYLEFVDMSQLYMWSKHIANGYR